MAGLSEAVRCSNNCVGVKSVNEAVGVLVGRDGLSREREVQRGERVEYDVGGRGGNEELGKGTGDEVRRNSLFHCGEDW